MTLTKTGCMPHFPKIFTLGQKYLGSIFNDPVQITEKVDGSQFGFGWIGGEFYVRSKGQVITEGNVPGMFLPAWNHVQSIKNQCPEDTFFYGEAVCKPKHNTLTYNRTPHGFVMLFGIAKPDLTFDSKWTSLHDWALELGMEPVRLLYEGMVGEADDLMSLLDHESKLGGPKIEGFVVKNFERSILMGDVIVPIMCGKFVSEAFKERHIKNWKKDNTARGSWESYRDSFKSEARWSKAVQHLRDSGKLTEDVKDIGPLIMRVKDDIVEEYEVDIKEFLWKTFKDELLRRSIVGLPEWYKEQLAVSMFDNN